METFPPQKDTSSRNVQSFSPRSSIAALSFVTVIHNTYLQKVPAI